MWPATAGAASTTEATATAVEPQGCAGSCMVASCAQQSCSVLATTLNQHVPALEHASNATSARAAVTCRSTGSITRNHSRSGPNSQPAVS